MLFDYPRLHLTNMMSRKLKSNNLGRHAFVSPPPKKKTRHSYWIQQVGMSCLNQHQKLSCNINGISSRGRGISTIKWACMYSGIHVPLIPPGSLRLPFETETKVNIYLQWTLCRKTILNNTHRFWGYQQCSSCTRNFTRNAQISVKHS